MDHVVSLDNIMFYVYILQSQVKQRLYIGKTTQGHQAIRRMLTDYLNKHKGIHFEYQGATT